MNLIILPATRQAWAFELRCIALEHRIHAYNSEATEVLDACGDLEAIADLLQPTGGRGPDLIEAAALISQRRNLVPRHIRL